VSDSDLELLVIMRYRMVECLVVFAAPAESQIEYCERECWSPSELAEESSTAFGFLPRFVDARLVAPELAADVAAIDVILTGISGRDNARHWTNEALRTEPEWDEVRSRASAALAALPPLGVPVPSIDGSLNVAIDDSFTAALLAAR
jgi:hypothetical protein